MQLVSAEAAGGGTASGETVHRDPGDGGVDVISTSYVPSEDECVGANGGDLFQPPLRADGRYLRDKLNRRFKLCSVNWYGGSDELFIPSGLDKRHRREIARLIRRMGFNSVRMPYSDEMVMRNPSIPGIWLGANPDLIGKTALDIFTACVEALTDVGLAVIVNDHITAARWCDGKNLCDAAWKNDHLRPFCSVRLTEDQWIENWVTIMKPFIGNGRVIGCDLRNEVRGVWGTMTWDMWATAAERCSERLLEVDKDWLMFVEGIGSANDCSGARNRPVRLSVPNRLVYSVHVYAWSGWGSLDPYSKRPYPGFALAMERNWGFLLRDNVAPVWVGEMGCARGPPSQGEGHYWRNLIRYLDEMDADFGYWAINPRKPHGNEKETWALTDDGWLEIIDDYRLEGMRKLMRTLGEQPVIGAKAGLPPEGETTSGWFRRS